jgi:hypothetical protein
MSEETPAQELQTARYVPEFDYKGQNYTPIGAPPKDICAHCRDYYCKLHKNKICRKKFPIKCHGHVLDEFADLQVEDFASQEEFDEVQMLADPVTWAQHAFGWEARWYQEVALSCTATKKVLRWGRRDGKSEALAINCCWLSQVNSNFTILVIAPYEVQVQKVFDVIKGFLFSNPTIAGTIKASTKTPNHRITFHNGSEILGFSSGAQSASGSKKIRGQDANYIALDEADYLEANDVEAILAILASHAECGLWASSTPTGMHKKFHEFCTKKDLGFKEFWYISAESPSWTEETETFFKLEYDVIMYEHEFLAEFGLQERGVFRNDLIDSSLTDYALPRERTHGSRVIIGADWNGSDIGVHITVVEAKHDSETTIKYVLLEKKVVKGAEFTQHQAVLEIAMLVGKYHADYVYVDAGYGEVQVEMLQKMGVRDPSTRLHKIVRPYVMQSKVEIRDPVTGRKIQKAAKPFMVSTSARELEARRLELPISEDTQVLVETKEDEGSGASMGLVQQMRNFAIERVSSTGLPTFSQGEDHTLTAYMLCITGFILEFSDLTASRVDAHIRPIQSDTKEKDNNEALANSLRQLDTGANASNTRLNPISSVFAVKAGADKVRKSIAKGNQESLRAHFSTKNINRHSGLSRSSRRKF